MTVNAQRATPDDEPSWDPALPVGRVLLKDLLEGELDPRWNIHGKGVPVAAFNSSI